MIKGIIHVHTKGFSYDAKVSFKEIKEFCKNNGYRFVAVTEHSESMNKKKMEKLVEKCRKMSERELIFIPGLEIVTKEKYEVLGIGIKKCLHTTSLEKVIEFIHKNKGIAILAHPSKYKKLPTNPEIFDGIELLNFEYNGFFPCPIALKLLKKARKKNKNTFGYFGLDIHRKIHFRNIFLEVKCEKLSEEDIIQSLKKGNFENKTSFISLSSKNNLNKLLKTFCFLGCKAFDCLKKIGIMVFKVFRKIRIIK